VYVIHYRRLTTSYRGCYSQCLYIHQRIKITHIFCAKVKGYDQLHTIRLIWYNLVNSMERNPSSEPDIRSDTHEISRLLSKQKVHHCVNKSPPLGLILLNLKRVHNLMLRFFKICFNIILPSKPRTPKLTLSFRFFD